MSEVHRWNTTGLATKEILAEGPATCSWSATSTEDLSGRPHWNTTFGPTNLFSLFFLGKSKEAQHCLYAQVVTHSFVCATRFAGSYSRRFAFSCAARTGSPLLHKSRINQETGGFNPVKLHTSQIDTDGIKHGATNLPVDDLPVVVQRAPLPLSDIETRTASSSVPATADAAGREIRRSR